MHRMAFYLLGFLFALITACSTRHNSQDQSPTEIKKVGSLRLVKILEPLPGLKIFQYRHPASQLDFYLIPQSDSKSLAYITAYNVGARFEVGGRTGLAHLFEHMMFRGTKSFPAPFKTLSNWGDHFNAFTAADQTVYHELVPNEVIDEVARFESERMRNLMITPEGFNTERSAVVSERKMRYEDNPRGRAHWELHQLAFDKHPYKTTPIGWQEDLDATTFDDALNFYRRYYAPNRAKIAIVGDFNTDALLDTLDKYYGNFVAETWQEPSIEAEPIRTSRRRKVMALKAESVLIEDAVLGPKFEDEHAATEDLLCALLGDSKMGYLSQTLVEKGLAQSVNADCSPNVDRGLSVVSIVGNPGIDAIKLERAYDSALSNFAAWATASRIEKMKLYYTASQLNSLRDPTQLGMQIASNASLRGNPLMGFDFLEKIKKVSRADILSWLMKRNQNPTRLIVVPGPKSPPMTKAMEKQK
jgi:zinc protease